MTARDVATPVCRHSMMLVNVLNGIDIPPRSVPNHRHVFILPLGGWDGSVGGHSFTMRVGLRTLPPRGVKSVELMLPFAMSSLGSCFSSP